jgi:hypothetical protein
MKIEDYYDIQAKAIALQRAFRVPLNQQANLAYVIASRLREAEARGREEMRSALRVLLDVPSREDIQYVENKIYDHEH